MLVALVLSLAVFAVLFGAMEVMVPSMLTGMVVGMDGPMIGVSLSDGARWGVLLGIACFALTYVANAVIVRQGDRA